MDRKRQKAMSESVIPSRWLSSVLLRISNEIIYENCVRLGRVELDLSEEYDSRRFKHKRKIPHQKESANFVPCVIPSRWKSWYNGGRKARRDWSESWYNKTNKI